MRIDRGVTTEVNTAIERATAGLVPPWDAITPVLLVTFPTSGDRLVRHTLGAVPDGVWLLGTTGAVYMTRQAEWTDTIAYLTAPVVDTTARLLFFSLRSAPEVV